MIFSTLVSLRLEEGANLADHTYRFRTFHNELVSNMRGTPDLKISEPFIAIMLLKSLPSQYSAIVQTTLASFETIKLSRIYTILTMESNRSTLTATVPDSAMTASSQSHKSKTVYPKPTGKNTTCSLDHSGHTDEQCKVRRFREMEKEIAELKKDKESRSKPEQAQAAVPSTSSTPSYWDAAFISHEDPITRSEIADTGASSHMYGDEHMFNDIHHSPPVPILIASKDSSIIASKQGSVIIDSLTLTNILHSDSLSSNLISIGKLCDDGYVAVFRRPEGAIIDKEG